MPDATITRADLVETLVQKTRLGRQECQDLLEDALNEIGEALATGQTVKLARFGNFVPRTKAARMGRNPKTGEEAEIAARRVVTFRASQILRARIENSDGD